MLLGDEKVSQYINTILAGHLLSLCPPPKKQHDDIRVLAISWNMARKPQNTISFDHLIP